MDIWEHARRAITRQDTKVARALGFDYCQQCGEWFHHEAEDWADCAGCGRYCANCAADVEWEWCDSCGLTYCRSCAGDGDEFNCQVCRIADHYR